MGGSGAGITSESVAASYNLTEGVTYVAVYDPSGAGGAAALTIANDADAPGSGLDARYYVAAGAYGTPPAPWSGSTNNGRDYQFGFKVEATVAASSGARRHRMNNRRRRARMA